MEVVGYLDHQAGLSLSVLVKVSELAGLCYALRTDRFYAKWDEPMVELRS